MNPARNAYALIPTRKLVACKRCGEAALAWVKLASGKWALCHTSTTRPVYSGQYQAPESAPGMVYANKLRFHKCNESRLLDLYAVLDSLKADCYRANNDAFLTKHGKAAAQWPADCAIELQASIVSIEHAFRAARQELPLYLVAQ